MSFPTKEDDLIKIAYMFYALSFITILLLSNFKRVQTEYMMSAKESTSKLPSWENLVKKYQTAPNRKSIWQLVNSFIPFLILWYLMYLSIDVSYWITLLLALPAAGFVVRIFIIQHDCGHSSFFKSKRANDFWGMAGSIITLTPYHYWRKNHAIHHACAGKLDQRGIGDIYTMTVEEYLKQSRWGRLKYRLYRNPFILFIIIPIILFVVLYRLPISASKDFKKFQPSVYITSIVIALIFTGLIWLVGWQNFLMIQLPITFIASTTGTWLFYVQHQFEDTYWSESNGWDFTSAAMRGSSYYKLPKVLQWFTGNIGFHHIHHLSPKIPNYLLEKCYRENPDLQNSPILTLRSSFRSMFLRLWDEKQKKLVSFRYFKRHFLEMQGNISKN